MAVQHLPSLDEIDDLYAEARADLAERGLVPGPDGRYGERAIPTIEDAIRARGWEPIATPTVRVG